MEWCSRRGSGGERGDACEYGCGRQHTSAYVSIRSAAMPASTDVGVMRMEVRRCLEEELLVRLEDVLLPRLPC
jgi:hypothetical protein